MKNSILFFLLNLFGVSFLFSQDSIPGGHRRNAIASLIDQYSLAREKKDTTLLRKILTTDVDQLVSNGEWRNGIGAAVQGMLKSSSSSSGPKTLTVDKIRLFNATTAIVDCRYEIRNTNGTIRKMWSSFLVVADKKVWKISAIRNMLPAVD